MGREGRRGGCNAGEHGLGSELREVGERSSKKGLNGEGRASPEVERRERGGGSPGFAGRNDVEEVQEGCGIKWKMYVA